MKSFPPELIYVLIFAAIMLFQFMMKKLERKARQEQEGQPAQQDSIPEEYVARTYEEPAETAAPSAPPSVPKLAARHFVRTDATKAAPPLSRRRFSRGSLMGNRRDVQNAMVIAAILGPCRAFEPHDIR